MRENPTNQPNAKEKYYYVYLAYESKKDGLKYIGVRSCFYNILPFEDINYMSSSRLKLKYKKFDPDKKIILAIFQNRYEAYEYEVYLHNKYEVDTNPEFANLARQLSSGFYYSVEGEENPGFKYWKGRKRDPKSIEKQKETNKKRKWNTYERSPEFRKEFSKKRKGKPASNKGIPHNKNTRAKISERQKNGNNIKTFCNDKLGLLVENTTVSNILRLYPLTANRVELNKLLDKEIEITKRGWYIKQ